MSTTLAIINLQSISWDKPDPCAARGIAIILYLLNYLKKSVKLLMKLRKNKTYKLIKHVQKMIGTLLKSAIEKIL